MLGGIILYNNVLRHACVAYLTGCYIIPDNVLTADNNLLQYSIVFCKAFTDLK